MQNLTSITQSSSGNLTIKSGKSLSISGTFTPTGTVDLSGATVTGMTLSASVVAPDADDGAALGSTSLKWSDLFLASGAVINFNSGNVTLTHSAGTLTMNNLLTLSGNTGITFTGTAITKGINFASAAAAMTDADDAFISVGTWNDAVVVGTQSAHFVPIQVHLHSAVSAAYDIAAARFRVDTSAANTANALGCLQLRQSIAHNVASSAILNASVSVDGAVTVQTGSLLGGYFSIEGTGAVTKAGDNDCTVLTAVKNGTGTGIDNVFVAMMNGTGATVSEIGRFVCEHGTATVGIAIEKTTNGTAIGTGLTITNATKGIDVSCAVLGATGRIAKFAGSMAAGNLGDGYGATELELTITGTLAGQVTGMSNWINVAASTVCGSNKVIAQDNGIYVSATGTPMASAIGIIGMRMQYVAEGGGNPGALHLFDTNIYDNVLTSLFRVNTIADMGGSSTAATGNDYKVPLFYDQTAGQVWYVNIYHS